MGFGNCKFKHTPTTYNDCERLWLQRSVSKDTIPLAYNTVLLRRPDCFEVQFHGYPIIRYYPDHKDIDAGGYADSPTTQHRISKLTGVSMHNNAALGFHEKVRVNGWPYFNGMRIDNFGHVLDEDCRPDHKTRPKRELVLRYTALWKRIYKILVVRWELGEFKVSLEELKSIPLTAAEGALLICEGAHDYIPTDVAINLIWGGPRITSDDLKAHLDFRKNLLRGFWYTHHNGYETIEVK